MPDQLDAMVREAIATNRQISRPSAAQSAMDECIEKLHINGELELAACLLVLSAVRVLGSVHAELELLMQRMADRGIGASRN